MAGKYTYNTGYCFNTYDLFETFNLKQLKIKNELVLKKYGCNKRRTLCVKILIYTFYLILLDIIENNVTFVLPLDNSNHASIFIKPIKDEELKTAIKRGAFKGIDFLSSNFIGYKLVFQWSSRTLKLREKNVYINKTFKDLFYKHINEGKQYY